MTTVKVERIKPGDILADGQEVTEVYHEDMVWIVFASGDAMGADYGWPLAVDLPRSGSDSHAEPLPELAALMDTRTAKRLCGCPLDGGLPLPAL